MRKVIDVSEFNGLIDWTQAKPHIDGAILRVGIRGYGQIGTLSADRQFRRNLSEVRRLGVPFGIYFLTQAKTEAEALAEVDFVVGSLGGAVPQLGIWLDSEHGDAQNLSGRADRLPRSHRTALALAFLRRVRSLGYKSGLYCAAAWFSDCLDGEAIRADGHQIWLASVEHVIPRVPWDGWQYTWKGGVPGIQTAVDISYFAEEEKPMGKDFTDTDGHWAEEAIDRMKERGLINGKTADKFAPDDPITRAEVAVIFDRLCQKLGV